MELKERIQTAHAWFCKYTDQRLGLTAWNERLWFDFFKAGYNVPQLKKVIDSRLRGIRSGERRPGGLKLSNLLDPDLFGEDLAILESAVLKGQRIPRGETPEAEAALCEVRQAVEKRTVELPKPVDEAEANRIRNEQQAALAALKRSL